MEMTRKIRNCARHLNLKALTCTLFLSHFLLISDVSSRNVQAKSLPLVFAERNAVDILPTTTRLLDSSYAATFTYLTINAVQGGTILAGSSVLFDTQNATQGNISYDSSTGAIQLGDPGYYKISFGIKSLNLNSYTNIRLNGNTAYQYQIQNIYLLGAELILQTTAANTILDFYNPGPSAQHFDASTYLIVQKIQ